MPTVKTREFKQTSLSGETMQFKAPITVDTCGEFTVNIPEELAESAQAFQKQPGWKGHITVDHARVNWRVQGRVLGEVERFVEEAMKEHLAVEISEELVIRYRHENNTVCARASDGGLHPNGHWAKQNGESDAERSWGWAGNQNILGNNKPRLFGVGVVACVYLKVTYTRPSGSKVKYTHDLPGSHWDQNPMRRLNSFIVQSPGQRGVLNGEILSNGKSPSDGVNEMPYSDAAATFFADLMIAMCRLGEQLDGFVGNQESLLIAIERGTNLLPAPTQAATVAH